MQKLYNVDICPDTYYHVSRFFGQEFNYTSEHEDAMPLIWLQNSVVGMEQEWKCKEGIQILMRNFWKKCGEDVGDARTIWQWTLEKMPVTVTGDWNWFCTDDSSLLECDAVLMDEYSPWRWSNMIPQHIRNYYYNHKASYPILSSAKLLWEPQILHGSLLCLVELVMLKPMDSTRVCFNTSTILIAGVPYKQREISSLILKCFHPMYGPQGIPFQRRIYICRLVMLLADLRVFSSICF